MADALRGVLGDLDASTLASTLHLVSSTLKALEQAKADRDAKATLLESTLKELEEVKAELEAVKAQSNSQRASTEEAKAGLDAIALGGSAQPIKPSLQFSSSTGVRTAMDQLREQQWQQLPARIILLRHGQAEHNLDHTILEEDNPERKPDNLCELTSLGRSQARSAGERIRKLLGNRGVISVIVSPFERTQQTLYALQQELGNVSVRRVHIDPRVREQEFGNFQGGAGPHSTPTSYPSSTSSTPMPDESNTYMMSGFTNIPAQQSKVANEVRRRDSSPGCWLRTGIYGPARVPASAGGALLLPAADGRERR